MVTVIPIFRQLRIIYLVVLWLVYWRQASSMRDIGIDPLPIHPQNLDEHNQISEKMNQTRLDHTFVFSDIDGTLVHYHLHGNVSITENSEIPSLLFLPPSSTGLRAHISVETLRLCQQLRQRQDTKLVLVSGMRTTTLFQRLPFLPRADAFSSENGGRIFYPVLLDDSNTANTFSTDTSTSQILIRVQPVAFDGMIEDDMREYGIVEDLEWATHIRQLQKEDPNIQTPLSLNTNDDELLTPLQTLARTIEQRNLIIDKVGYSTCMRLNWKQQRHDLVSREDFDSIHSSFDLGRLGLQCSINLGCIDFFPLNSGKKNW